MSLHLEIVVPDATAAHCEAAEVIGVDATGSFGLLPGHEDFCAALVPSILIYRDQQDQEHYVAVDGGVLILEDDQVSVATREAVPAAEPARVANAVTAMLRARRDEEQEAGRAFRRLVAELLEQLPQLEDRR